MASRLDFSTGGAVNTGNNISSAIANVGSLFDKFMAREEDRAWREQQRQDALDRVALEREDRSLTRAQAKEEFEKKHALDTMKMQSAMTNDGLQAQKYLLEMDKVRADMRDAEEKKASQRAMASAVQSGKFEDAYSQAALDRYGDKVASVVTQNNLAGFSTFDDADKAQLQKDEARALRSALVDPALATSGAQGRVGDIRGTVLPGATQLLSNEDVRDINRVTASRLGVLPEDMTRYADYMAKGRDYAAIDKQALEQDKEYKDNLVKMAVAGQRNANVGASLYMKDGKVDMTALTKKLTENLDTTDSGNWGGLGRSDKARALAGIGYTTDTLGKNYSQAQIAKGLDFVLSTMREGDSGDEFELNEEQTADAVKRVLDQGIVDTVDKPNSGSSELSADKVIAALGIRPRSAREVSELNFMQGVKDRFATPVNMDAEISRRSLPTPQQVQSSVPTAAQALPAPVETSSGGVLDKYRTALVNNTEYSPKTIEYALERAAKSGNYDELTEMLGRKGGFLTNALNDASVALNSGYNTLAFAAKDAVNTPNRYLQNLLFDANREQVPDLLSTEDNVRSMAAARLLLNSRLPVGSDYHAEGKKLAERLGVLR